MPFAPVLIEIGTLALALACLAIALLIVAIMRKVGDLVRGIWLIGGTIADGVDAVAQGITWVLGKAIGGVEAAIGASWHLLASLWGHAWSWIVGQATGFAHLAELVARLVYAHSGLKTLVHQLERAWHGIEHGVKTLERKFHGIEHRVADLSRAVYHGIGHDLRIGLKRVEKKVDGIIDGTVPALQRGIDGVGGELTQLEQFIKTLPGTSYLDWAAGIVTAALGVLGLEWLTCKGVGRLGRGVCNMPGRLLEDLLELLAGAVLFESICEILPFITTAVDDVGLALVEAVHVAGLGACSSKYPPPPPMPPIRLSLPTSTSSSLSLA